MQRNHLAAESSPYLRQHADNPVDWYRWGKAALSRAKQENKPILLSVGYAACHWCHVMAHESFEDPETAALMNRWFVNIKVDREEPCSASPFWAGAASMRRSAAPSSRMPTTAACRASLRWKRCSTPATSWPGSSPPSLTSNPGAASSKSTRRRSKRR